MGWSRWELLAPYRQSCIALLCSRYHCQQADAEDAVSCAVLELACRVPFPTPENPLAAMFQVSRHRLLDRDRRERRVQRFALWLAHTSPQRQEDATAASAAWHDARSLQGLR